MTFLFGCVLLIGFILAFKRQIIIGIGILVLIIILIKVTKKAREKREKAREEKEREYKLKNWFSIQDGVIMADIISGRDFEFWCAELLRENHFNDVQVTRGSGNFGVNITAYKDGQKYAIQCCTSSFDNIGTAPIHQVINGMVYYQCNIGAVMINRHFTHGAKELAKANNVLLCDRDKLLEMLENTEYCRLSGPST